MLRKTPFTIGEFYHLYSRGVEKRKIFLSRKDYERFKQLLYVCNTRKNIKLRDITDEFDRGETIVEIGAYCIMPNHVHVLIREKQENGISIFMKKIMTGYSMYFNKRYDRSGALFEGVFKSVHCSDDRQLKYLYSYIHLNPAKLIDKNWRFSKRKDIGKLFDFVSRYNYSSLKEYLSNFYIVENQNFPEYFLNPSDHKSELIEWLTYTQDRPV